MTKSETINELAAALSKAQGKIKGAIKDSKNPFFKSTYADLSSVWDACREALNENGLAVIQTTDLISATEMVLETILTHSSGQWIEGKYRLKPVKDDPQSMGSAVSYARRYALAAIVGVYQTDEDGNMASGKSYKAMDQDSEDAAKKLLNSLEENLPMEEKPWIDPNIALKRAVSDAKKAFEAKPSSKGHDHAWKKSNYPNQFGEEQEYCVTCKLQRPLNLPKT